MHYSISKFRMEHLDTFDCRKVQEPELRFLKENPEFQKWWVFYMPVFTLFYDKEPIMIYGIQNSGYGTYYPMVFAAKHVYKHRFAVIRSLYKYVEEFVGEDVRRFEAYVSATDDKANKLARFFGFEPIGFRRQAGMDGGDQVIYERLWRK